MVLLFMETIQVKIKRLVYQKDDFVIAIAKYEGDDISIKGTIPGVRVDTNYELMGGWSSDKYGQHFKVESSVEKQPTSKKGIEAYLASGLIAGIGPTYAHNIVEYFGEDTFMVLDFQPERLREVPGIGRKRAKTIMKSYAEQRGIQEVMMFLKDHGITNAAAAKIYRQYGNDSIKKIKENPYILADDIHGIGFKTADKVALSMGYANDGPERLHAALIFALGTFSEEGHTFAPIAELLSRTESMLEVMSPTIQTVLEAMCDGGELIEDDECVYLPWLFHSERGVAKTFAAKSSIVRNARVDIPTIEAICRCSFADNQRRAIEMALTHGMFVLTGGPGVGKTFTTQGIIQALEMNGEKLALAAPTGRAAKRLAEVTGKEAKTIHRLLEYTPKDGFQRDDKKPLDCTTLIIDEASMVDISLMYSVCKALRDSTRLILVGDADQLPSVGAGNVLKDVIASDAVPCVKLTEIFRQAQDSQIVMNSHDINRGIAPTRFGKDFFFAIREDRMQIQEEIIRLVTEAVPKMGYKRDEVQVLCPMRRGGDPIAASELNKILQSRLNPYGEGIRKGMTTFRAGDRVMQMKNNYDNNVFNGDTGTVLRVDTEGDTMDVSINGDVVTYYRADFEELELAYASTIHKSQGSEYPVVIIPIHESQFIMLERNLLYTAVTRAKKTCIIIGTKKAMHLAVSRHSAAKRYTRLALRIINNKN